MRRIGGSRYPFVNQFFTVCTLLNRALNKTLVGWHFNRIRFDIGMRDDARKSRREGKWPGNHAARSRRVTRSKTTKPELIKRESASRRDTKSSVSIDQPWLNDTDKERGRNKERDGTRVTPRRDAVQIKY